MNHIRIDDATFDAGDDFHSTVWNAREDVRRPEHEWPTQREIRPLVVIDPEDDHSKAAVEITQAIGRALNHQPGSDLSHIRRAVNGALRSLVAPPKPDEPLGLGAVVEDAGGERWLRTATPCGGDPAHWQGMDHRRGDLRRWREFAAVRVLSEGVAPDAG